MQRCTKGLKKKIWKMRIILLKNNYNITPVPKKFNSKESSNKHFNEQTRITLKKWKKNGKTTTVKFC